MSQHNQLTPQQQERLDHLLAIIKQSAEDLIIDNRYSDRDLLLILYRRGFEFLQNQGDQTIVDIGSIGLAYAVRRAVHAEG